MNTFFTIYLLAINLLAFIIYGVDKYKAIHNRWRISEHVLFAFAILGGSLGAFIGMKVFQHKTSVPFFKYGIPTVFILQLLAFLYFYIKVYDRVMPF